MTTPLNLPNSVLSKAQFSAAENLILPILRDAFPTIPVLTRIELEQEVPAIVLRRTVRVGPEQADPRFIDQASVSVDVFADDPDGDEKAQVISDAIRAVLFDKWLRDHAFVPGVGSIARLQMPQAPVRRSDWGDSAGPVQFADLPIGWWRYRTVYDVDIRRPIL